MIPEEIQWALEAGRAVRTLGGIGPTIGHRVADLVLPTGVVLRVPAGADPAAVAQLVAALGASPC